MSPDKNLKIISPRIAAEGLRCSLSHDKKMYELVPGLRCVRMGRAAPLFFKHSDVMAAIITNEVTVIHSEWRQCNVPIGLKNTLWPKGGKKNRTVFYGLSLPACQLWP